MRRTSKHDKEVVTCLKCFRPFYSVDKRTNRLCKRCAYGNSQLSRLECARGASVRSDCNLNNATPAVLPPTIPPEQ